MTKDTLCKRNTILDYNATSALTQLDQPVTESCKVAD